jgi:hypothetical protein
LKITFISFQNTFGEPSLAIPTSLVAIPLTLPSSLYKILIE